MPYNDVTYNEAEKLAKENVVNQFVAFLKTTSILENVKFDNISELYDRLSEVADKIGVDIHQTEDQEQRSEYYRDRAYDVLEEMKIIEKTKDGWKIAEGQIHIVQKRNLAPENTSQTSQHFSPAYPFPQRGRKNSRTDDTLTSAIGADITHLSKLPLFFSSSVPKMTRNEAR
jgi:hypothetical protein